MKKRVKVVYFEGCPNARLVLESLSGKIPFDVIVQNKLAPADPFLGFSSPSVFVDEKQVIGTAASDSGSCTFQRLTADNILASVEIALGGRKGK